MMHLKVKGNDNKNMKDSSKENEDEEDPFDFIREIANMHSNRHDNNSS